MKTLTNRQLVKEFNKFLRENNCASKFYVNRIKHLKNRVGIFLTETQEKKKRRINNVNKS